MIGLMSLTIHALLAFRLLIVALYLFVVTASATTEEVTPNRVAEVNGACPKECELEDQSIPPRSEKNPPRFRVAN